jgi:hypothetical protein
MLYLEEELKWKKYGYTLFDFSHMIHTSDKIAHEPFIFLNQADQVFYIDDNLNPGWSVVLKMKTRDIYDMGFDKWEDDIELSHSMSHTLERCSIMERSVIHGLEQTLRQQRLMLELEDCVTP